MKSFDNLFYERRNRSWIQALKIIRLISSSSGFPILVGILLILLYMGYVQLLELLHPPFPIELILALLIAWSITFSTFRTWLQKPDTIFLLPMEDKLTHYFQASLRYNRLLHFLKISLILILLYPFFSISLNNSFVILIFFLLIVTYQVIYTRLCWDLLKIGNKWLKWGLFFFHFLCIDSLLEKRWILFAFSSIILFSVLISIRKSTPFYPWPWTLLINLEQKRVSLYHNMASWFIDLPRKKQVVKRRTFLVGFLQLFEKKQPPVFSYLYWRRFLRDDDYLYPYLRLLLFFSILIMILSHPYFILFLYTISLFLTAIQLPTLANADQYPIWMKLYPKQTEKGLSHVSFPLLGLQSTLLSIIAWLVYPQWLFSFYLFLSGWLFTMGYGLLYLPYKEQQKKKQGGYFPY